MSDAAAERPAAPRCIVIQTEGETFHEVVTAHGWVVIKHTNSPFPWLAELENLLQLDAAFISPAALVISPDIARDVNRILTEQLLTPFMFIDDDNWVELTLEDASNG